MGRSAAERKKDQLDKLKKEGKYDLFKRNASAKQKERRMKKKMNMSIDEKHALKIKRREEQRKHRYLYTKRIHKAFMGLL